MKCLTHASGIIWKVELDTSACMISTQRFAVWKCHYESSHHCVPKMGPRRGVRIPPTRRRERGRTSHTPAVPSEQLIYFAYSFLEYTN